jgi:hypothetical protein
MPAQPAFASGAMPHSRAEREGSMQHAEAQERLSDLALEPVRLARLGGDPSPEAGALRAHLAECRQCSDDLAGWHRTWALVGAALEAPGAAGSGAGDGTTSEMSEMLRAPASLRGRTLARIAAQGDARGEPVLPAGSSALTGPRATGSPRGMRSRRWVRGLAMAAALVIALGAGSVGWVQTHDLDRARAENAGLTATMASLDRVLATPDHWTVTLRTPDGTAGGSVAWSGSEIAVITIALPSPTGGQSYRCWVERDGVRTPIGPMWFSGSTGYWAGPTDGWAALLAPGARLGVSLVPADGGPDTPVLVGTI